MFPSQDPSFSPSSSSPLLLTLPFSKADLQDRLSFVSGRGTQGLALEVFLLQKNQPDAPPRILCDPWKSCCMCWKGRCGAVSSIFVCVGFTERENVARTSRGFQAVSQETVPHRQVWDEGHHGRRKGFQGRRDGPQRREAGGGTSGLSDTPTPRPSF